MALGKGLSGGHEAGGVVTAALGRARPAGSRAGVVGNPDAHRLGTGFEVVTGRTCDDDELVLLGRTHAEEGLGRDHEGPQVERAALDRGIPVAVDLEQRLDRAKEQLLRQGRHGEPLGRGIEARGVGLGPEQAERAVGVTIGLEPFEDLLRIVQHARCGIEADRLARAEDGGLPAAQRLVIVDHHHVIGEHGAEARIGDQLLAGGIGRGRGVGKAGELHEVRLILRAD